MKIEIESISIDDGGGYCARFSDYSAFIGAGDTPEKALEDLKTFTLFMYGLDDHEQLEEWKDWLQDEPH